MFAHAGNVISLVTSKKVAVRSASFTVTSATKQATCHHLPHLRKKVWPTADRLGLQFVASETWIPILWLFLHEVSRTTRSGMAGELKSRYLRGKNGLHVTSLEQSFNTDMSSDGSHSRRQAETGKGCKLLFPRCWLCSEQRCILLGLNVCRADSLALTSLEGQQLPQLLVLMLSRSDPAVLAVV